MRVYVQTVLGRVSPEELGVTLMHEHLLVDLRRVFVEPEDPSDRRLANTPLSLDNLSWTTLNWCKNRDNLILSEVDLAVREAGYFKQAGGGTLVDVTTAEFGRDPLALCEISRRTGLHVVMGCGHYHALFHPPDMGGRSEDEIADGIIRDIVEGVGQNGVRAGIIGEVGCSWPLHPNEAKVLRASARAQRATGAPLSIHPGRSADSPFEILDILEAAGADVSRIIMGHMERSGLERARLSELARRGCYLEYDWFGEVRPAWPYGRVDVPSDGERIKIIASLIHEGFLERVLISHDVCFKTRLASYGGPGYAHIVKYVSHWMQALGITAAEVETILIKNARQILQFS